MSKGQQQTVTKGVTVLTISNVLNKLLALAYVPILTMIIGNEGNGVYNAGYTIYTLMFVITNTGIPIAIAKLISEFRAEERYKDAQAVFRISRMMVAAMGAVAAIWMAFTAKSLAELLNFRASYLSILALAPTVFITSLSSIYRGYFQGYSNMTPTAVSQIIEQFFNSIFTVVFAYLLIGRGIAYGSMGATVGTTVGAAASFLYLYYKYRKELYNRKEEISGKRTIPTKKLLRKLIYYGLPITIGAVGTSLGFLVDTWNTKSRLVVAGFTEQQAIASFGILTTQYQKLLSIPLSISLALGTAIIPAISTAMAQGDQKILYRKIHEAFRFILMITIPSAVGLAVISQPIINILFPGHPQGAELLTLGSSVLIFMSIVQIQTSILQSIGKTYIPPVTMIMGMGIKIIVNYVLIANPHINILGAVIGTMASYLFIIVLNFKFIQKHIGWKLKKQHVMRPLIASIGMGIVVWVIFKVLFIATSFLIPNAYIANLIPVAFSIMIGGAVYGLLMFIFKGIRKRDIDRIPTPIRNKILSAIHK